MIAPNSPPAGFCPYCGYRIDPGVCAECGRTVDAKRLAKTGLPARIRSINRGNVLAAVILIVLGVWAVQYYAGWLTLLPAEVLLLVQGDDKSATTMELHRRCLAGELGEDQIRRMILRNVTFSETVRSPAPTGVTVDLQFSWRFCVPSGMQVCAQGWKSFKNGQLSGYISHGPIPTFPNGVVSDTCHLFRLKPGRHEITIEQGFLVAPTQRPPMILPVGLDTRATVIVEVTDEPLSGFARKPLTTQPAESLTRQFRAHLRFHEKLQLFVLRIKSDPITTEMAWTLQLRASGQSSETPLKFFKTAKDQAIDYTMTINADGQMRPEDQFDLELMSDGSYPFNSWGDSYIDLAVKWRSLKAHIITAEELANPQGIVESFTPATSVIEKLD